VRDDRKTLGRKWLGILAVCFVVVALAVIAFAARRADSNTRDAAAQKEVQERLASLRQANQPVSIQDLAARYPDPPPEHDAELLLQPALAVFVKPKGENLPYFGSQWPASDTPIDPQLLAALGAILETNKTALQLIPSNELKSAWVGCGFANGFTNDNETLSSINALSRMLCLDAVFKGVKGDTSGSAKSLVESLLIVRTYKNDTIVHGFWRGIMDKRVCESLNQILNRAEMSEADLKSISDLMPVMDRGFVKELYVNERSFYLSEAESFKMRAGKVVSRRPSTRRMIYRDEDLLEYLDGIDATLAALDLPLSNGIPKLDDLDKEQKAKEERIDKENRRSALSKLLFPPQVSLFGLMVPHFPSSRVIDGAKDVAYERAALTAIAIERYRLSHAGRLPENLSVLVPEFLGSVPKDPFDDRDLRFKKLEHGYVVYSVGPDFTDDNGEPEPAEAQNPRHYDVIFSVTR